MSLAHAILGLLTQRPWTGYDLKTQCFDGSVAHFWPADQSQIYRMLDKLLKDGFVTAESGPSQAGPPRKIYTITKAGMKELDRWLSSTVSMPEVRDATLIQVFFVNRLPKGQAIKILDGLRQGYQARLEAYLAVKIPRDQNGPQAGPRMTLELGIAHAKAGVAWADACLHRLRRDAHG